MSPYSVNNFNCCTKNFEEARWIIGLRYISDPPISSQIWVKHKKGLRIAKCIHFF